MHQRDFEAERGALQCRHCQGRGELVTRLNFANNGLEVICPRCGRWDPLNIGGYLSRREPKQEAHMPVMTFGKYKGPELRNVPTGALDHYLGWDGLYEDQRQAILAELKTRADAKTGGEAPKVSPVPDTIRRCAFDLIKFGEDGLLKSHPALKDTVREAGTLLRAALQLLPTAKAASETTAPR